jgi:hypothetical protein
LNRGNIANIDRHHANIQTRAHKIHSSLPKSRANSDRLHHMLSGQKSSPHIWFGPKRAISNMAFSRLRQRRQTLAGRVSSRHSFV